MAVRLGDFEFKGHEIPEHIPIGTSQRLAVHELVGGAREINAMGPAPVDPEWSGIFLGPDAIDRAQELQRMCAAGKKLILAWDVLRYEVVIESVNPDFERFYQVPYKIKCIVKRDLSTDPASNAAGIDSLINADMVAAKSLSSDIGDGPLSGLMGTLDSAIGTVSSFATAAQSTINGVLQPLADVQARVKVLTASVGNTMANVTTLGGVLPNNPISQQAAKLSAQIAAAEQSPKLFNLQNVLGRMGGNLDSLGSGKTTATAGGNLFDLASKYYGDASAWTTLASANNLDDPNLVGVQEIKVPATSDNSGGVKNA